MIDCKVDVEKLLALPLAEFGGPVVGQKERFKVDFLVNDPRGVIAFEAFEPGKETKWAFWHDEVHVIWGGEAEVTYSLPPDHNKVVTKTFRKGDCYLILDGTRATFNVTSSEPYLHICIIMPRFEYSKWQLRGDF